MEKETTVHPTAIITIPSSNFELGEAIAKLRYDQICELLSGFIFELREQLGGDKYVGNVPLAEKAEDALAQTKKLAEIYAAITILCEPHLKDEFEKIPISSSVINTIKQQ